MIDSGTAALSFDNIESIDARIDLSNSSVGVDSRGVSIWLFEVSIGGRTSNLFILRVGGGRGARFL